jgi:hypothetical protein
MRRRYRYTIEAKAVGIVWAAVVVEATTDKTAIAAAKRASKDFARALKKGAYAVVKEREAVG